MAQWLNSDGLNVKLGVTEGIQRTAGEFKTYGPLRQTEVLLTLTGLLSTVAIQDYDAFFPKNARIEQVDVEVDTAATSGGSATLDVGLQRTDQSTLISNTSFIAAAAVATLTPAGTRLTLTAGSTAAGAAIGTTLANAGYIIARYNTAAFTAGVVRVRVHWRGV